MAQSAALARLLVSSGLMGISNGSLAASAVQELAALEARRASSVLAAFSGAASRPEGSRFLTAKASSASASQRGGKPGADGAKGVPKDDDPANMVRVILLRDVKRLGKCGQVVVAKRGLMRHTLYPQGLAAYATPENLARFRESNPVRDASAESAEAQQADLNNLLKALNKHAIIITRPASAADAGAIHGPPVTAADVIAAVKRQRAISLHSSHFLSDSPIGAFGSYRVPLNLRSLQGEQVELTVHVDRRRTAAAMAGSAATAGSAAEGAGSQTAAGRS